MDEEIFAALVCVEVLDVVEQLDHFVATASAARRLGMCSVPCWWYTHASSMTPATFYQRFRMWPSALARILSFHRKDKLLTLDDMTWRAMLRSTDTRDICHALEYLVHGV